MTDSTRDDPFETLIGLIGGDPDAPAFTHAWTANEPISMHDLQQMADDWRDGAALRRLREALPDDHTLRLEGPDTDATHPWWAQVMDQNDLGKPQQDYTGITIAEAADKCRQSLSERS